MPGDQITVTQKVNAPGMLTVNGMEFDYVQPLDFLLEHYGLPGFGFNGNLTLLDQKSSGSAPAFATGVPPMSYNVTGYYDHDGISVRLSYVWNDTSLRFGLQQPEPVPAQHQCVRVGLSARRLPVQQGLWSGGLLQQHSAVEAVWRHSRPIRS